MADDEGEQPNQNVQALAIRPPAFNTARIKGWFTILESQLLNSNITQSATKFRHVISNLPLDVCEKLSETDLASNNYDDIKEKLISLYTRPEPAVFQEFISRPPLLNTKPSLFLQQIRNSASTWNLPDEFLKTYFLNAMPPSIKASLLTSDGTLDETAKLADHLMDYIATSPQLPPFQQQTPYQYPAMVNATHQQQPQPNTYQQHQAFINATQQQHQRTNNYAPRRQSYNNNCSLETIPLNIRAFNEKQRTKVCRFHLYYGWQAKRCKPWCILNSPDQTTLPNSRPPSRSASPARQQTEN